jgi:hypothetical protein
MYSAQGTFSCPSTNASTASTERIKEGFRPAWVDDAAKKAAWSERSAAGFPLPATEWQDGGHETHGRVASEERESFKGVGGGARGVSTVQCRSVKGKLVCS